VWGEGARLLATSNELVSLQRSYRFAIDRAFVDGFRQIKRMSDPAEIDRHVKGTEYWMLIDPKASMTTI
jgi:hypothetical protein